MTDTTAARPPKAPPMRRIAAPPVEHPAAMRADPKLLAGVFLVCAAGYLAAGLLGWRVAGAHTATTETGSAR